MKKFSVTTLTSNQFKKVIKDGNILEEAGKHMIQFDSIKDLEKEMTKINRRVFMGQMKIEQKLPRKEIEKLYDFSGASRTGWNYKDVVEVGNYRFQEIATIDSNNVLKRRYFILDFNELEIVEERKYAKYIYEIDIKTFAILISDICSAKLDLEQNIQIDAAKQALKDAEEFIGEFIEDYLEKLALKEDLNKL